MGIFDMQERAELVGGKLEILSSAGEGTKINAVFPLSHSNKTITETQKERSR